MSRILLSYERNYTNLTLLFPSSLHSFPDQEVDRLAANEDLLLLTRFVVQKLCVPLVVLIGVIGNFLSVVVLTRKCMNSSTNSYLTALAVFDLLYLLFSFYLSLKHHLVFKYSHAYIYCFPFARVFTDMFANVSVILTVTFTLERYIGVCHPMKGRILCTVERAKVITVVAAAVAILCTSPEFWEMEVTWVMKDNESVPVATYTTFAYQSSYAVGYYWFLVVIFTLLPLTLLCVFNGILIVTVVRAAEMRKQLTLLTPVSSRRFLHVCSSEAAGNSRAVPCQPREQQKITKILITIVIVFIVCQIPGALLLLYKTYTSLADSHMTKEQENNLKIAGNVINLLIQINASINFILYSAISTKFRRVFYHIICNRKRWCYRKCQLWHQSNLSRSDGLKMSSFYGAERELQILREKEKIQREREELDYVRKMESEREQAMRDERRLIKEAEFKAAEQENENKKLRDIRDHEYRMLQLNSQLQTGDRTGSKPTSYPTYTCKIKLSQRSSLQMSSPDTGMTPPSDVHGVFVRCSKNRRQQNERPSQMIHNYNRLLLSRQRVNSRTYRKWTKHLEQNENFVNDVIYSNGEESILGSLWPCSTDSPPL